MPREIHDFASDDRYVFHVVGCLRTRPKNKPLDRSTRLYCVRARQLCFSVCQGKLEEADPLSARAIEIKEAALGPDQPNVATSLASRGIGLHAQVHVFLVFLGGDISVDNWRLANMCECRESFASIF